MLTIEIETSAHHCHLSREDFQILFGENAEMTKYKELSQTGQFATNEFVDISVGEKEIKNFRILGPERKETQVELSKSDAYFLGIEPPIKECTTSGKELNALVKIIGPCGEVEREAAICAFRHLHTDPQTAKENNFKEGQLVSVKIGGRRSLIFDNVLIRINPAFVWRLHLDTDETNAADIGKENNIGEVII